jgi:hypothetical protein
MIVPVDVQNLNDLSGRFVERVRRRHDVVIGIVGRSRMLFMKSLSSVCQCDDNPPTPIEQRA